MNINQNEEIKTINERPIILNLSSADVERLCDKAASIGLTPSALLENFIGDLVCGTYTNGSDERMYANNWFNRCDFSMSNNFLNWLFENKEVEIFVEDWYLLKSFEEDAELGELSEVDKIDMKELKSEFRGIFKEYEAKHAVDHSTIDREMQGVLKWYEEKRRMSAGIQSREVLFHKEVDEENEEECY